MEQNLKEEEKIGFDLKSAYEKGVKLLKEGDLVKGRIISIGIKDIIVDLDYKSEGVLSVSEFPDTSGLKIGDELELLVEKPENEDGMVVVSKRKAEKTQGWDNIINNFREGDFIEGKVSHKVKGGLMVDVGVEAFLPASLIALKGFVNTNQMVGQTLKFKIVKLNRVRKNIVLSRKDALLKEREEQRQRLFEEIKTGELRKGVVKNITDFGAFIDLGGVDGLLHITDMSWGRVAHPSEILAIGDTIEVKVLSFDRENKKIALGIKQKTESPWKDVESKYPVGTMIKGKVVNIMPYGAFVEVEKGLEGLVHVSELSWTTRINNPNEVLAIGDVVEAIVLNVDVSNQKLSLGIKQIEPNPWIEAKEKFPVGTKVFGKVRNITDYGAYIELEGGLEGFLHVLDISWTRKVSHPKEVLKKGQEIEVVVLAVDSENQKMNLGIKQLAPDPWSGIIEKYKVGTIVEGLITKITNFGIFVELEKDLEALIHISELDQGPSGNLEESYKVGDKVKAIVIKVDELERKIGLSAKQVKI